MGGKWDATNVVDGRVAVVTNVSIDHVEYLGPTLDDIATEKAGIVKPVLDAGARRRRPGAARHLHVARSGAASWSEGHDFGVTRNALALGGRLVDLYTPYADYYDLFRLVARRAPGRQRRGRDRRGRVLPRRPAAGRRRRRRVRDTCTRPAGSRSSGTTRSLSSTARTTSRARRRSRAALDEEFPRSGRALVVGMLREKEPHEMLEAMGASDAELLDLLRAAEPTRAVARDRSRPRRAISGLSDERVVVVHDVDRRRGARGPEPRAPTVRSSSPDRCTRSARHGVSCVTTELPRPRNAETSATSLTGR